MKAIYSQYFSTGYLAEDINMKFALISLIGYMVYTMRQKRPDVSYYEVCKKLMDGLGFNESEIKGLAILVEDFSYGCKNFPTFDVQPRDMPKKVKEILQNYMPF